MSLLLSFDDSGSADVCESAAKSGDSCCCKASGEGAAGISAVPGSVVPVFSTGVGTRFDGVPEAALVAAADAAAVFQVSEAVVVSAPDCALASALANRTSSIAASDAPSA